jgi:predicted permease
MAEILLYSFNAVSPLFFVIGLGWAAARRGLIQERESGFLNALCFRYLFPLYIISSVIDVDFYVVFNPKMFLAFLGGISFMLALSCVVFSFVIKERERRCIYIVNSYRSNNLIYALPLASHLFGGEGRAAAAMLAPFTIILFNFFSVSVMVHYAQKDGGMTGAALRSGIAQTGRELLRNPLLTGSLIGIAIALLKVEPPFFIRRGLELAGSAASPVSFLLLGSQIDFSRLREDGRDSLISSAVRLVLCPLLLTPPLIWLGFRGPDLSALSIAFAAPCAISTCIMSRNYNIAPRFAAKSVCLSTILSVFTIFCFISIMRLLRYF